jgi:hypothetical protein
MIENRLPGRRGRLLLRACRPCLSPLPPSRAGPAMIERLVIETRIDIDVNLNDIDVICFRHGC